MNYIPYVLEQNENGERGYDIYSRLLKDRIILLVGEINDEMSSIIVSELLFLDSQNNEDINIYIIISSNYVIHFSLKNLSIHYS